MKPVAEGGGHAPYDLKKKKILFLPFTLLPNNNNNNNNNNYYYYYYYYEQIIHNAPLDSHTIITNQNVARTRDLRISQSFVSFFLFAKY